jgi:hypothetical protein
MGREFCNSHTPALESQQSAAVRTTLIASLCTAARYMKRTVYVLGAGVTAYFTMVTFMNASEVSGVKRYTMSCVGMCSHCYDTSKKQCCYNSCYYVFLFRHTILHNLFLSLCTHT